MNDLWGELIDEEITHDYLSLILNELNKVAVFMQDNDRSRGIRPDIIRRFLSYCLTDDERAQIYGLPPGCRLRENAKIISPERLTCGSYVWIGEGAVIDASGGLEIGDHTSIGLYVLVWTHSSYLANIQEANIIGSSLIKRKATRIGRGCFIAGHSVIYPGVNIPDHTVVLPMSVVTNSIEEQACVVGGVPARKIRALTAEELFTMEDQASR